MVAVIPTSLDIQPNTHDMVPANYPLASGTLSGPHSAEKLRVVLIRHPSSYTINALELNKSQGLFGSSIQSMRIASKLLKALGFLSLPSILYAVNSHSFLRGSLKKIL
jgi:hypothetical protein